MPAPPTSSNAPVPIRSLPAPPPSVPPVQVEAPVTVAVPAPPIVPLENVRLVIDDAPFRFSVPPLTSVFGAL